MGKNIKRETYGKIPPVLEHVSPSGRTKGQKETGPSWKKNTGAYQRPAGGNVCEVESMKRRACLER